MTPRSILQRFYTLVRAIASPIVCEPSVWIVFTLTWLLTIHYVHLPGRSQFASCLLDLWFTLLLFTITLRLTPRRFRMFLRIAAIVVFVTTCWTEAFLSLRFKMVYEPTIFSLVTETNGEESSEFLQVCLRSSELWHSVGSYALVLLCAALPLLLRRFAHKLTKHACAGHSMYHLRHSLQLLASIALTALTLWQANLWWDRRSQMVNFLQLSQSGQAERVSYRPYYSSPLRLIYSLKFYDLTRREGETFALHTQHLLPLDSCTGDAGVSRIILVIGESYNKHHAALYGYEKPTTPNLSRMARRKHLTVFSDVVSPWNITSQVMKWTMSTQSIGTGHSWADGVLWPSVFRQAGWPVAFITNQYVPTLTRNKIDYSGSFFLNTQPLDSLSFDFRNRRKYQYDGQLLTELDSLPANLSLTDAKSRADHSLVIIHLIGQHMDAKLRVPENYWRWSADDYTRDDLSRKERQIVADYDNATRYNDHVLACICQRFRSEDAIVIYFSDHGEEVYHPSLHMYGRNHTAHPSATVIQSEYEVPFMIWTSPRCRRRHPALCRRIRQAADRPFMTDDICHLLFGLAGISTPYYQSSRDLFSPAYETHRERLLKASIPYINKK